jgi:uncharacterized protein YbjT (DUF2867 family)
MSYKVVLIGATGLIGSELLKDLIASDQISEILSISRKPLDTVHDKLTELTINFEDLEMYSEEIKGDIIYSCLGTTRNETPDEELYKKIDFYYPLKLAVIALKNRASQLHIVSSLGADAGASNSYLKLKGELEAEIIKLKYKSIHIYQPSFLTGKRQQKRTADKILTPLMRLIDSIMLGPLRKYRSIAATTVSKAMLNQSLKSLKGIFIYPSIEIQKLA